MKTPILFAILISSVLVLSTSKSFAQEIEVPEEGSRTLNAILVEAEVEDTGGAFFSSRSVENIVCSGDVCTAQDESLLVTITGDGARRFFDALAPIAPRPLPSLVCQVSYGSKAQCFVK